MQTIIIDQIQCHLLPLSQGQSSIIDLDHFEALSQFKWSFNGRYAVRTERGTGRTIYLHREITQAGPGQFVDHINRNKLDNRRSNLRIVTQSQNQLNLDLSSRNTSGFRGVTFCRKQNRYRAVIRLNQKQKHLGSFVCPVEAAHCYDRHVRLYHGDYGVTNF